jgi:uncharacterized membrane protein YukC
MSTKQYLENQAWGLVFVQTSTKARHLHVVEVIVIAQLFYPKTQHNNSDVFIQRSQKIKNYSSLDPMNK